MQGKGKVLCNLTGLPSMEKESPSSAPLRGTTRWSFCFLLSAAAAVPYLCDLTSFASPAVAGKKAQRAWESQQILGNLKSKWRN